MGPLPERRHLDWSQFRIQVNKPKICEIFQAAAVASALVACGQAAAPMEATTPSPKTVFLSCPGDSPPYVLAEAPKPGCRELVAGADYADGRVLVGVRGGTSDAELDRGLATFHAAVVSRPAAGRRLLTVPAGAVPQAVVGLARYPFITFAQPDLLQHPDQPVT